MGTLGAADICCAPHEMSLFGPRNFSLLAVLWPAPQASVLFLSFSPSFFSYMLPAAQKHWAPSLVGRGLRRHVCRATKKIMAGETLQKPPRRIQARVRRRRWCPLQPASRRGLGLYSAVHETTAGLSPPCFQAPAQRTSTAIFYKVRHAPRPAIV